jgi:endonuclease/exonuclease/phosphatase (EEP) superfamily protein YafD
MVGAAAAAAALLPFLGPLWWVFDVLGALRPQYAAGSAAAALGAAFAGRRLLAGVLAGTAAIHLAVLWPYLTGIPTPVPPDAPLLKVVAFNVEVGNPERDRVAAWLAAEDPDVVLLSESSFEWEDAVRRAGLDHHVVAVVPPTRLSGITVLVRSEYPARVLAGLPVDVSLGVAVQVDVGGAVVEIVGLHPPSPLTGGRSELRDAVLAAAGDWVASRDQPVLVVGDLNAAPWSHAVRRLEREADLTNTLRGRGLQPSWPAGLGPLMITIDHALIGNGLVVAGRRTGPSLGSDHRPLIVTVAVGGV